MAEIPVRKKGSGLSWLWWLLLIAGIIALLVWIFTDHDKEPAAGPQDNVVAQSQVQPSMDQGDITTLAALAPLGNNIGRQVELNGVPVNRMVGDAAFTVGQGAGETLVMFDETQTPDMAKEGLVNVKAGSNVSITGTIKPYNGNKPASVTNDIANGTDGYIEASRVSVVDGASTADTAQGAQ